MQNLSKGLIINIIAIVEEIYNCEGLLGSKCRQHPLPDARKAYSMLCKKYIKPITLSVIGRNINRDHSSILNHLKKHEDLFTTKNKKYIAQYKACEARVKGLSDEKPTDYQELLQEKIQMLSQKKCEALLTFIS